MDLKSAFMAAVALGLAASSTTAVAEPSGAAAVLAANQRAMAPAPSVGTFKASYAFAGFGLTGITTRQIDLATGAFVELNSGDPVSIGSGYDGSVPWMRDFSGANTAEQGGDKIALAVNQAYRNANLWWRADFGGAQIMDRGADTIDGVLADRLTVTPKGGEPFDAWFDAKTHLLIRVGEVQGFFPTRQFFSDYARLGGVELPRTTTLDIGAGPANYETLTLRTATVGAALPASAFARPEGLPTGGAIAGDAPSADVPFRLLNNHIYVQASVDGKGPYTFIVDSGGHLGLSPRLVAELGATSTGNVPSSGVGAKMASMGFVHVGEIKLGAVRLRDQTAFVGNIYDTAVEGIPVDGMLGFEFFRRFAVRIDYARQVITVTDPRRFTAPSNAAMIPFKFYDHLPDVRGSIDGIPARFDIDTGSRSELDLTAPFVKRTDMHAKYPNGAVALTGWGVGGPVQSTVIRLPSIVLGGVTIDQPVAELSDDTHGSFSDANYDGNIGSALLKRFVVTFDYEHQRLYLQPSSARGADVGSFDRAGLWINAGASGFIVTAVDTVGPAADAGLQAGDVITALNGKPARAADLSAVREALRVQPAGSVVRVDYRRGAEARTATLTLRDLIPPPIGGR